jgi:hypothetical protein
MFDHEREYEEECQGGKYEPEDIFAEIGYFDKVMSVTK